MSDSLSNPFFSHILFHDLLSFVIRKDFLCNTMVIPLYFKMFNNSEKEICGTLIKIFQKYKVSNCDSNNLFLPLLTWVVSALKSHGPIP